MLVALGGGGGPTTLADAAKTGSPMTEPTAPGPTDSVFTQASVLGQAMASYGVDRGMVSATPEWLSKPVDTDAFLATALRG
jgi:hypothetical protein